METKYYYYMYTIYSVHRIHDFDLLHGPQALSKLSYIIRFNWFQSIQILHPRTIYLSILYICLKNANDFVCRRTADELNVPTFLAHAEN